MKFCIEIYRIEASITAITKFYVKNQENILSQVYAVP